jgi:hypothetical protein
MPQCIVKRAVKTHGTRYAPGAVIDLTDSEYEQLAQMGVVGPVHAPSLPPPKVRVPRTAKERQETLDEAQARMGAHKPS